MSAANLRLINWIRDSPWPFRNESLFQKGYRHNYDSTQPVFVRQVVKDTVVNMKRNGNDHSRQKLLGFTSRKGKAINGKFSLDVQVFCLNKSQADILDLYDVFSKSVCYLIPRAFTLTLFLLYRRCIREIWLRPGSPPKDQILFHQKMRLQPGSNCDPSLDSFAS